MNRYAVWSVVAALGMGVACNAGASAQVWGIGFLVQPEAFGTREAFVVPGSVVELDVISQPTEYCGSEPAGGPGSPPINNNCPATAILSFEQVPTGSDACFLGPNGSCLASTTIGTLGQVRTVRLTVPENAPIGTQALRVQALAQGDLRVASIQVRTINPVLPVVPTVKLFRGAPERQFVLPVQRPATLDQPLDLLLAGDVAGLQVGFLPNPVSGTQNQTVMTLRAQNHTALGSRNVALGVLPFGAFVAPNVMLQTMPLSVVEAFSLAAIPSSVVLRRGSSVQVGLRLSRDPEFAGAVQLSVGGCSCQELEGTLARSVLTIAADRFAEAGNYVMTVRATSGSIVRDLQIPVEVI